MLLDRLHARSVLEISFALSWVPVLPGPVVIWPGEALAALRLHKANARQANDHDADGPTIGSV